MARIKVTEINRTPGNVFVSVPTPKTVQQVLQARRYFSDWQDVANQIVSSTPITPEPTPVQTEPLKITPNPTPAVTIVSNPFTEPQLLDIIEKMTALDIQDGARAGGWHCEDAIFKVARVNLKHNVTAPVLRQMLSEMTERGVLEHKREWGLNKFRLAPKPALKSLLTEVDTILDKTGIADAVGMLAITMLGWAFYVVMGVC